MARVDDYLDLVAGDRNSLESGHPADEALLGLLVHVAFSDGHVDDHELSFLQRVLPDRDEAALREWVTQVCGEPLNLKAVAQVLETDDERWKCLRYAARMAWKDGYLAVEEKSLLESLAAALHLPANAVERTLKETSPRNIPLETARVSEALKNLRWDTVQVASGELVSQDLATLVPVKSELVARIGLDSVETIALFTNGLVGRFLEGAKFLFWDDIVTYTHGFGLGSAVQLHTEDGRRWTFVDARLNGVGPLLDRLFGADRPAPGARPVIELLKGEDDY
ncbi:MAG: TerB family tellurite resistance protein [Proteobacteria bacterium]|jgi:hypothetical protein|nr:TerB family tellurite resistance protein [Pseudomonadota bacterium]